MKRPLLAGVVLVAGLFAASGGCGVDPGQTYDDFLERADRTPQELPDASVEGQIVDLEGNEYLMNIAITRLGEVFLRLRLLFTSFEASPDGTEASVTGELRFENETEADPPAASFESTIDSMGRMEASTGVVFVPADRSPVMDVAVEVELNLVFFIQDEDNLCGQIEDDASRVLQPITLELKGTTFGAKRIVDGQIPADVPTACPSE